MRQVPLHKKFDNCVLQRGSKLRRRASYNKFCVKNRPKIPKIWAGWIPTMHIRHISAELVRFAFFASRPRQQAAPSCGHSWNYTWKQWSRYLQQIHIFNMNFFGTVRVCWYMCSFRSIVLRLSSGDVVGCCLLDLKEKMWMRFKPNLNFLYLFTKSVFWYFDPFYLIGC